MKNCANSVGAWLESQRETDEDGEVIDEDGDDCCELYYHVGIKWTDGRPALRLERLRKIAPDVSRFAPASYRACELADTSAISFGDTSESAKLPARVDDCKRGELVALPRYMSGGDYSGSTLERANYLEFVESFPVEYVKKMSGDYGSFGIALDVSAMLADETESAESILEALEALEDYPLLNDEVLSNLEMELSEEGWKDWARDDFRRELEKLHNVDLDWSEEGARLSRSTQRKSNASYSILDALPRSPL